MKAHHRKTLWVHTIFAIIMVSLLAALLVFNFHLTTLLIALFVAVYIGGHVFIHMKRDDLKPETIVEYALLGAAVFVVLVSALK